MDVLVQHKVTKEKQEMSEHMLSLLKDEYELAPNQKPPNQRPVIEQTFTGSVVVSEGVPEQKTELTHDQLVAKFQEVFGKKPGNMKDETIRERIEEETKFVVSNTGE